MNGRPIPIKRKGKVVGYINPPLRFRLWHAFHRLLQLVLQRKTDGR